MSLKHILNDDSLPLSASRPSYSSPSRLPPGDQPVFLDHSQQHASGPLSPLRSHHQSSHSPRYVRSRDHLPHTHSYSPQSASQEPAGAWDPRSVDWVQDTPIGTSPNNSNPYSQRERSRVMSPDDSRDSLHEDDDAQIRKKRKGGDEDPDYQPVTQRRVSQRKSSRKTKQSRPMTPGSDLADAEKHDAQGGITEEERRLASSDLEDCDEIWFEELSDYILETKKRQNQVEMWFKASILERNSTAAQHISHHYASRISRIPLPPPSPQLHIPRINDDMGILSPVDNLNLLDEDPSSRRHHGQRTTAEDAALEFERSVLGDPSVSTSPQKHKNKAKDTGKRPAPGALSDDSSDLEVPKKNGFGPPANKKRRLNIEAASIADDIEKSVGADVLSVPKSSGAHKKGKGKQVQREPSHDSVSAPVTSNSARKKMSLKKKIGLGLELENHSGSRPPSASGDVTPSVSRPASPAPTNSTFVYELDEPIPPLKKAKKVDDAAMLKRIKGLEEAQKKVWTNIAKRDVAKVYKYHITGFQTRQSQLQRIARLASVQARRPFTKTAKANKDIQAKAKRLMREMQVFWKKNEKEERDVRKREHKEAMDRLKIEEEKREAARQARKLEFLISQTELYSHFVGSKLKTTEIEGDGDDIAVPAGVHVGDVSGAALPEIDFDDDDNTNLHRHARHNAQEAVALAKQRAQLFDTQTALERKTNEALKLARAQAHIHQGAEENDPAPSTGPLVDLDSDELNFQNPTSLSGQLTIGQPKMLMAQLKEYQLKGLNWLATLYEQGINGILADEMGLGKTVQSISLLAYLAETHDIWGPFLVVAPASTLHNWQQEITRFVPGLKALPYWGNVKDRTTLRKFWSKKEISYNQDAPFHVLITSYQLVTQDQQYFQRVKWQYMILDEAQNIKNSSGVRWKTLLGFHCRNRLLLTGTPIQNSMQELWALLHFIMPSLFDSHDEFNEWFSKDIENAAENKGSKLNEHQLRRLHMILKPFMLRRVKRHVQNELSEKIEKDIYVDLSARQRALYTALLANVSVADLLEKAANIGDVDSARSLMNLVMQFRKVCNHPELFERADVVAPFSFSKFGRSGPLMREGDFVILPYSTRNPIEFVIPSLFYKDGGLLAVPCERSVATAQNSCLQKLFNIWSTDWIYKSLCEEVSSSFSFLRFLNMSPEEAHTIHISPFMSRRLRAVEQERTLIETTSYSVDPSFAAYNISRHLLIPPYNSLQYLETAENQPHLRCITSSRWKESCLSRPELRWFVPPAVAPPISLWCKDRSFLDSQAHLLDAPLETLALYGVPLHLLDSETAGTSYKRLVPGIPPSGLMKESSASQLPMSTMQVPEAKRLIYDSAKLARLDTLLQELKAGDHRVLVYFQMTRMMDLMEEYLIYRQYKYLRLDGSSKLEDRRDMVIDWQTRPDIFIFLLSTRAGGLGINLTAADTVVFYDHDWNPSNDAQAMDRAHRLGQTRQVTVYRLITRGTIDERIVQLARVKKDVQDIVVGNKNFTDATKPSEIVQLLLNDEQLASLDSSAPPGLSANAGSKQGDETAKNTQPVRDLWNEEGDDFFGHSAPAPTGNATEIAEDDGAATTARGKRRKPTASTVRGRKSKKKADTVPVGTPAEDN